MSTYEELQIILTTALLIVAILTYTHKIAVLIFGETDGYFLLILLFHRVG